MVGGMRYIGISTQFNLNCSEPPTALKNKRGFFVVPSNNWYSQDYRAYWGCKAKKGEKTCLNESLSVLR